MFFGLFGPYGFDWRSKKLINFYGRTSVRTDHNFHKVKRLKVKAIYGYENRHGRMVASEVCFCYRRGTARCTCM